MLQKNSQEIRLQGNHGLQNFPCREVNHIWPAAYYEQFYKVSGLSHIRLLRSRFLNHLISSQSLNLAVRRGTTDDVATIPFHPSLSSAAFRESPNPIPIHSLMLVSHLFFLSFLLLSLSLAELSSPCQKVLICGHTN